MPIVNYSRPNPGAATVSRPNDQRYQLLTRNNRRPPTDKLLDLDYNYLIDAANELSVAIDSVSAGILPGVADPSNLNKFPTPDGAGSSTWSFVSDVNIGDGTISGGKIFPQSITAIQLVDGGIPGTKLIPLTITTNLLADECNTLAKQAPNSVDTSNIVNGSITLEKLALDSVSTVKIVDLNITTAKIADANVTTVKIADANITTAKILDANVTTSKVADGAITLPKIAAGVLTAAASKAEQIAAASTTVYTNPAVQQNHPSALKFWCSFDGILAGTNAPISGYNVASVTKNSTGNYTINFIVPFSSTDYIVTGNCRRNIASTINSIVISPNVLNTTNCIIETYYTFSNQVSESPLVFLTGYGTQ